MRIAKIRDVKTPTRGTSQSAGLDFYVPNDFVTACLKQGDAVFIPSGIKIDVPNDFALIAFNKSGVALKKNLSVGACVVDSDYQGEVHLHVYNFANTPVTIEPGEKLVQMVLLPVSYVDVTVVKENDLFETETQRGTGGFGSTGIF